MKIIGSGLRVLESVVSVLGGVRIWELGVLEGEQKYVRPYGSYCRG